VGSRLSVEKNLNGTTLHIKGDILAIKQTNNTKVYYVHYLDFNKQLDKWVHPSRLDLRHVEMAVKTPKKRPSSGSEMSCKTTKSKLSRPAGEQGRGELETLRINGKLLIGLSYECQIQGIAGSPEKPLSPTHYSFQKVVAKHERNIVHCKKPGKGNRKIVSERGFFSLILQVVNQLLLHTCQPTPV